MTRGIPGKQVYKGSGTSTISWESISSGLPALPVNCLLYRYGSTLNELFAGTDAVFIIGMIHLILGFLLVMECPSLS